MSEKILTAITANGVEYKIGGATKVNWDANSNMNDFKTPGVYDIYGERTVKTDNLPIMNDGGGHSISCKLTVVASTLQPSNNEICVTQFLQLSNRMGGEGNTYIRTYNENNNGLNGWSPWQKQMGMIETLINSDDTTVGQEIFSNSSALKIGDGLNGMIDNGMYSGIYIDNVLYNPVTNLGYLSAQPTFVETFVLIVINDYAATGKLGMQRHITQLKYAVNAMTGESTIKKRLGSGSKTISWGDWEDANGSKTILWGESSNMNDYKTAGTYEIYGDRINVSDNLPILNSNLGHSIAAKLTVVDSSLRKTDGSAPTEICVTQFLQLSNRIGGEGATYVRTYNENNNGLNGWSAWQKMQGVQEGYIFTNTRKLNQDWGLQTVKVGLNWMVDNGNYNGVYINEEALLQKGNLDANGNGWGEINTDISKIKFIETFNITTINDYAVAREVNNSLINLGLGSFQKERQICQVKTATDFFSSTSSIKKRVYLGNDSDYGNDSKWSEWEEIGGSGEVDITEAVKAYGLPTLISQGYAKEGVTYKIYCPKGDFANMVLDKNNKLSNEIITNTANSPSWAKVLFNVHFIKNETSSSDFIHITGKYYTDVTVKEFIINGLYTSVKVSADMTEL